MSAMPGDAIVANKVPRRRRYQLIISMLIASALVAWVLASEATLVESVVLSGLAVIGAAALTGRHRRVGGVVLVPVAVVLAFSSTVNDRHTLAADPVPGAPDGAYTPSSYSDALTDWCGERSVEDLAMRFGVASTARDAARAVADEARTRRDPYWFAAFEGCWRGLGEQ